MLDMLQRVRTKLHNLPDKKRYVELLTALLTVPVLVTVLLLNIANLRTSKETPEEPSPTGTPSITIIEHKEPSPVSSLNISPSQSASEPCIKEIGPIEIVSPAEGTTVTTNPLHIDIQRNSTGYCQVVWSYRINNDPWSDYIDSSIYLYNVPSGQKTIEVRVKSIVSHDQTLLRRTFYVPITPNPLPESSTSGIPVL